MSIDDSIKPPVHVLGGADVNLSSYTGLFEALRASFDVRVLPADAAASPAQRDNGILLVLPEARHLDLAGFDDFRILRAWHADTAPAARNVLFTPVLKDIDRLPMAAKRHYLPLGIDAGTFQPAAKSAQAPVCVAWTAPCTDEFAAARAHLAQTHPHVRHVDIDAGLDAAARAALLAGADIVCADGAWLDSGALLLEAMACGAFPLAAASGAAFEAIDNGITGILVDARRDDVADSVRWAIERPAFVRHVGRQNANWARANRQWPALAQRWQKALAAMYLALPKTDAELARIKEFNLGKNLGEWHGRAELAGQVVNTLAGGREISVVDMGCGKQGVRKYLAPNVRYQGVDSVERDVEQITMDIGRQLPENRYDIAMFLGVFEYFEHFGGFLEWAKASSVLVFSFNDCANVARSRRQNWWNLCSVAELEDTLRAHGGTILNRFDVSFDEYLYVVSFGERKPHTLDKIPAWRRIGLLSAGVDGDNSGDALITSAVKRILFGNELHEFPLLKKLSDAQIAHINTLDYVMICGTNLYQTVFACPLDLETVEKITVPIIPFGVGSSAELGAIPVMREGDAAVVRRIHERCKVSSVRDPYSLAFLNSIGVHNVQLTGCPVLFHALKQPEFMPAFRRETTFAVRARLLHCPPVYQDKAVGTIRHFAAIARPRVFLQSPYDIELMQQVGLSDSTRYAYAANWDESAMIDSVLRSSDTIGFRLHFSMLTLSYGKPTLLIGSDTRSQAFCAMAGVPHYDIDKYSDEQLTAAMLAQPDWVGGFTAKWQVLRQEMRGFLHAYGIRNTL